jgi:AcrR family transcriptional regulator
METKKKRHVARSPEDLAAKRDMILDAAMDLLVTRGYSKTTMSDIAEHADVGRGTVYWHFPSKDELFVSLMARETAKIEGQMQLALQMPGRAVERLETLIRVSFSVYDEAPQMMHAFMSFLAGSDDDMKHQLMGMLAGIYGKYNGLIEELLEQGKSEGDIRPDLDSPIVAAGAVVLIDAMYLQIAFGLVEYDPDRLSTAIISVFRDGYTSRPGDGGQR